MMIHRHEVRELDRECADHSGDPPLEEQRAEKEWPCEEAVEEFGPSAGKDPVKGGERVGDSEEAGHQGHGGDATEAHFSA